MTKTKSKPKFKRTKPVKFALSEQDIEILKAVYRYRFLHSRHLFSLISFSNIRALNRRLRLLYEAKYLDRPISQVQHWEYGKGKRPMVYGIGNEGGKFLQSNFGWYIPKTGYQTQKNRAVKPLFIAHTLEIADFMISLEVACKELDDIRLIPFEEIMAVAPEKARRRKNTSKWLTKVRWNGQIEKINLVPDAIFGLHFTDKPDGRNKAYFFLEMDRGTMPLTRKDVRQTSFLRKLESYRNTHKEKLQTKFFGIKNFRVLTVTTGKDRASNLIEVCKENIKDVPAGVFLFTFQEALKNSSPLELNWLDSKGKERVLVN